MKAKKYTPEEVVRILHLTHKFKGASLILILEKLGYTISQHVCKFGNIGCVYESGKGARVQITETDQRDNTAYCVILN